MIGCAAVAIIQNLVFVANNLKVGDGNNESVMLNYSLPTSLLFENDLCLTCTFKA